MPLRGLYSFVEDFRRDGKSVDEERRAKFGNGWVKTVAGEWQALTKARFTASGAEWEAKDNIEGGLTDEPGWFRLATGGDIRASNPLRTILESVPTAVKLPDELLRRP